MTTPDAEEVAYRRTQWRDVAHHLTRAAAQVEAAQGVLEDLRRSDYADNLQPLLDQLRAASTEAEESAT